MARNDKVEPLPRGDPSAGCRIALHVNFLDHTREALVAIGGPALADRSCRPGAGKP